MYKKPRFLPAGDCALVVEFGDEIDREINEKVREIFFALQKEAVAGVTEMVPTYRSLLICYNPLVTNPARIKKHVVRLLKGSAARAIPEPLVYDVPTLYGGEFGPDLEHVAEHCNLSREEVVRLHCEPLYRIYMLGFTPGFCYLGGLHDILATPRLPNPRVRIPAGSVGIAGKQTGIYPIDSPGGWQLIGVTPLRIFDTVAEPPFLFESGNYIRFVEIDRARYREIKLLVESRKYKPRVEQLPSSCER